MLRSEKKVIELKDIISQRFFTLPKSMANEIDLVTGRPVVFVGINGNRTYLPVETPTPISYSVFCALKDRGLNEAALSYEDGEEFV